MRSAAHSAALPLSVARIAKLSIVASGETPSTLTPLRGAISTRPSKDSSSSASLIGVRLIPNSSEISSRSSRVPGGSAPVRMRSRSSRTERCRTVPPIESASVLDM